MSERLLPIYVVCDESYSMMDHMAELNNVLRQLHQVVATDHRLAGYVRLCLIGFADTPKIRAPLSKLDVLVEFACQALRAGTSFGAVATLLRETIERDMRLLRQETRPPHRPMVFFLSDGQPTDRDDWRSAFDRLLDQDWSDRPYIISFGIGDADLATVRHIGSYKAYMGCAGTSPASVVREFASYVSKYGAPTATTIERARRPQPVLAVPA